MMNLIVTIFLFIVGRAQCQWVENGEIPISLTALSPDGTTAIGSGVTIASEGIYVKKGNTLTLVQPTSTFQCSPIMFLSIDGSSFSCTTPSSALGSTIRIYTSISPTVWSVSSTIYGTSLGLDEGTNIFPSTATLDGQTMIVYSSCYAHTCPLDFFVLVRNDTNYVLLQQLLDLPYDSSFTQVRISADGSTIAISWFSLPVTILSRDTNGKYVIIDASFEYWTEIAISLDGKILVGAFNALTPSPGYYIPQLHFFSLVEGQYEFTYSVNIGQIASENPPSSFPFCISSDASTIFTSVSGNYFPNQLNSIVILQQSSQTTWSIVQTVTNPFPPNNSVNSIFCTKDGSALLVDAYIYDNQPPFYETLVYTGPIPSPHVSVTPTATSTASSTTSSTASASTSSTASPTLSSSATTSASSTSTSTSTTITSSTETPIPIPSPTSTSTSGSSSSSSSSVSSFSSIENTAITVTSTALSILLLALCVTLVRRYYRKRSFRFCEEEDEEEEEEDDYNYNNLNATIENRTDPLLRVN
jgi:hypothetical protein